jgi:hydroxymethylbilane synthase
MLRLGQADRITQYLDDTVMVPAVGQGALCIETREDDRQMADILKNLDHFESRTCVQGERAFLKQIEGSCHIPVACFGRIQADKIHLTAVVASEDGQNLVKKEMVSPMDMVEDHGRKLAVHLLENGGKQILETIDTHDR